ncbi:MAG: neutral zinc metallopeptidase [Microbispora sp.]|nr:neutral zinc metallopeptidase [Microbispora sp.]
MTVRRIFTRLLASTAVVAAFLYGGHSPDSSGSAHSSDSAITLVSSESSTATAPWCYGRSGTFSGDLQLARCLTEQYWARQFKSWGKSYRWIRSFTPYVGTSGPGCGGGSSVPGNAFYCPQGHYVAYDVNMMSSFYKRMGNAAIYAVVQHEFSHSVQAQLNVSHALTINHELQADCMAGATLRGLVDAGQLWWEPGDQEAILNLFMEIGDKNIPWTDKRAHGSYKLRSRYYWTGYQRGVFAC